MSALDIDGIKIRSDVEGGASKRSYNYRVRASLSTVGFTCRVSHAVEAGRDD
jgi:hypothetical protein